MKIRIIIIAFICTATVCKEPTSSEPIIPLLINTDLNFENLPDGVDSGILRFKVVVTGHNGVMPYLWGGEGEPASHIWLIMAYDSLQEILSVVADDSAWNGPLTLRNDQSYDPANFVPVSFMGNKLESIWYGPVALMDTIYFEIEMSILDDLAFCCGRLDTAIYQYGQPTTTDSTSSGDHLISIGAAFVGLGLTQNSITLEALGNPDISHGPNLYFDHRTGRFIFAEYRERMAIRGYNSLKQY